MASPGGAVEDNGFTETVATAKHPAVSTTSDAAFVGSPKFPGFPQMGTPAGNMDVTDHNTDRPTMTTDSDSESASDCTVNLPDHIVRSAD